MPARTPDNPPSHNPDDVTSAVPSPSPHADVTAPTAAFHTPLGPHAHPAPPASPALPLSTAPGYATIFNPGDTLLNRYRIVARLGKGGMGEVYRADDLALGAPVALKFLPPHYAADPVWTERFRSEVRLTRQISHPNVCRVYDIAELPASPAGAPASGSMPPRLFLAMEYIHGEDLASLLRRIGRLPHDKAVQIARQICFGLAAAHEQGVVHRDLKPANIMLDGRGNARITDFGVAGLVEQFAPRPGSPGVDIIAGTPAYMAPEQLAGREVSKRSDIYALGLVLYELFTGKRAITGATLDELRIASQSGTRPTRPSELIADLDPAVERVILRCLEFDPAQRPPSAIAVAAALPGGDPLAAALAAGETPSPELVARSGELGALSARTALVSLAGVILLLISCVVVCSRSMLLTSAPPPLAPDALAAKARELSVALGNKSPPAAEAFGFMNESGIGQWLGTLHKPQRDAALAAASPAPISFWLRQSPADLQPSTWWRRGVTIADPTWRDPGHVVIVLGPTGRLLRYCVVPYEAGFSPVTQDLTSIEPPAAVTPPPPSPPPPPALDAAFRAAGLDPAAFSPVAPLRTPPVGCDRRYAFIGPAPTAPPELGQISVRVEAAALADHLVAFTLMGPWDRLAFGQPGSSLANRAVETLGGLLVASGIVTAVILTRVNLRKRRSDTRGALALGVTMAAAEFGAVVLPRNTIGDLINFGILGRPVARALWLGVLVVLVYLALEPIVRKRNPTTIISWARLVTGDWRNPRIGRDLLLGLGLGAAMSLLILLTFAFAGVLGDAPRSLYRPDLTSLSGSLFIASALLAPMSGAVAIGLSITLLLVGVEALVRRRAIVYPLMTGLIYVILFAAGAETPLGVVVGLAGSIALLVTLVRVGILGTVAYLYALTLLANTPLVASLSRWDAAPAIGVVATLAALATWAAYRASLGFHATPATPASPA